MAALRQTGFRTGRCNSCVCHHVMPHGGYNLLRCGRSITAAAMAALRHTGFRAGRCNSRVCHHVMPHGGHNLLCRGRPIAAAAMAALRQTGFRASRCNSGIYHHVMSQCGHNLLLGNHFAATTAMASFGQSSFRAGRCNSRVCHHVMSQGIHIVLLDRTPAGASPQCVALLSASRRHDRVLILVTHVSLHDAVDGKAISAVVLVRHQPNRQRIPADGDRLPRQLRPGVLRPVHIEVVDIRLHLSLRRESHIQRKRALRLIGIGLIQIILIIMAGLRVSRLVQGLGLFLMYINLQLCCIPLVGDIDHLFPSRGHVVAAQLQQAGIIRNRLHTAVVMGQRHADAACVQRTIRHICGRTDFAGNICDRRIAVSLPIKILAAVRSCCGSPCLILIGIKCAYIEISKSTGIRSRSIPDKSNTPNVHIARGGSFNVPSL